MRQKTNVQKERKFFLNNINSWFSNFIIEEFRTDYLLEPKVRNEFMGTLNNSTQQIPKLFEPKIIQIDLGFNYNQEVFTNDIFIFNMDDANLQELDFIINGLITLKYDTEKTLILVSNLMTWAKTPQKIYTKEQIENDLNFNEEEFIPSNEEIIEDEDLVKKQEEIKVDNNNNIENNENEEHPLVNDTQKEEEKKEDNIINDENASNKDASQINSKIISSHTLLNLSKNNYSIQDNKELTNNNFNSSNEKIFYYRDNDYTKRIPSNKYLQYKLLEDKALNNDNPNMKVYIILPGYIYGCGENFFYEYFRMAWLNKPLFLPVIGDGNNQIPTIHILDLIQAIRRVIEKRPQMRYIIAVDKTKNSCLKNIIKSISKCVGTGKIKLLKDSNLDDIDIPNSIDLSIDAKMKFSKLLYDEKKDVEDMEDFNKRKFNWHCEFGIPENIELIRKEFNIYRNLNSVKIFIIGPPSSFKTKIAEKISQKLKLTYICIKDLVEWAKTLSPESELGKEVQEKLNEIDENIKKALEEYEHRKNKKKTDPPLDTSKYQKFNSDFIAKLLKTKITQGECVTRGYILDGFPKKYVDAIELFHNKLIIEKKVPIDEEGDIAEEKDNKDKKDKKGKSQKDNKRKEKEKEKEKNKNESNEVEYTIQTEIKYELLKDLLPNNVIFINNATEDKLKENLKNYPNYEENIIDIVNRFTRRFTEYNENNNNFEYKVEENSNLEINPEEFNKKNMKTFFEENKIEIFNFDYDNALNNFDDEFNKMYSYLERNGPVNSYERMADEENDLIDLSNNSYEEIYNEQNEELIKNEEQKDKVIKEEIKEEKEESELSESKESEGENKEESENNNSEKNGEKINETQKGKEDKKENNNNNDNNNNNESSNNDNEENEENEESKENKNNEKSNEKLVLSEEEIKNLQIQKKLEELKEREKKLLDKKSEVLRRYLSENVIPLLAKGVLYVCQNMPEDPVEELANFLIGTSFNKDINDKNAPSNKKTEESNINVNEMMEKLSESGSIAKNNSNNNELNISNEEIKKDEKMISRISSEEVHSLKNSKIEDK